MTAAACLRSPRSRRTCCSSAASIAPVKRCCSRAPCPPPFLRSPPPPLVRRLQTEDPARETLGAILRMLHLIRQHLLQRFRPLTHQTLDNPRLNLADHTPHEQAPV